MCHHLFFSNYLEELELWENVFSGALGFSVTRTTWDIMFKCLRFENSVVLPRQKREGFCQLLQQMKNKHSEKPEPDMITVFVGTWNMGNNADVWHALNEFLFPGR